MQVTGMITMEDYDAYTKAKLPPGRRPRGPCWLTSPFVRLGWTEMEELGPSIQRDVVRCDRDR